MKKINAHSTLALPALAALCLWSAACGGASHKTSSTSRSASDAASRGPAAANSAGVAPASESIAGDYDRDDDYNDKRGNDGDNDNSKPTDRDNDSDNSSKSYFDSDDSSVRDFGRAASAADRRAITELVKRYFASANAEDGATACSMIVSTFARSVPEDLGRPPGPTYAQGTTCAEVMSKIFKHYHRQLAAHAATLTLADVRVEGDKGIAVLAFKKLPGRQLHVAREGGVWKADALLDLELP